MQVTDARVEDSGEYACQVAHHGDMEDEMDMTFSLRVLGEERERARRFRIEHCAARDCRD